MHTRLLDITINRQPDLCINHVSMIASRAKSMGCESFILFVLIVQAMLHWQYLHTVKYLNYLYFMVEIITKTNSKLSCLHQAKRTQEASCSVLLFYCDQVTDA